jgi:5-methylcytosine-specific restriction enzyme subunit McrC
MKRLVVPNKTVRLNEWQTVTEPSLRLTDADRKLANQMAGDGEERCLILEELREGLRIEARSWVGVVRFAEFDVCVEPKLAGNNIELVKMVEYATGLDALKRFPRDRSLPTEDTNLFDLIALLLAEACSALVKGGLQSDYVVREDVLHVLRGRLLADQQVMKHFGRVDLLECRYDEYETDIPENQLLAAALDICSKRVKNDLIRRPVRHLLVAFKQICDPSSLDLSLLRQTLSYTRLNEHYRNAHALAWLVLDGLGISDLLHSGTTESFVFLIDMNRLFERFLWRVLNTLCSRSNLRVRYQIKNRSVLWNGLKNEPYSSIIPDFLIDNPSASSELKRCLPIDAKYKLYDELKVGNVDIYQCFLYAFAYEQPKSRGLPRALLLYPATKDVPSEQVVEIRNMDGNTLGAVHALSVPIPPLLQEVMNNEQGVVSNMIFARIIDALNLMEVSFLKG